MFDSAPNRIGAVLSQSAHPTRRLWARGRLGGVAAAYHREGKMDDLDKWKKGFDERMNTGRARLDRLKMKYGVK